MSEIVTVGIDLAKNVFQLLGVDTFKRRSRKGTSKNFSIICIVHPWTRTAYDSWIWYHTKRLERFGGRTPAAMVNEDRCAELKNFLEAGEALTRPWPPSFPIYYTPKDVRVAANG